MAPETFPPRLDQRQYRLKSVSRAEGVCLTGFAPASAIGPAEETNHPREVIEAALAHVVQNRVEAAYRRTDLFERRRRLMNDWAAYLAGQSRGPEAGPIR